MYNNFIDRVSPEKRLKKRMIEHMQTFNINLKDGTTTYTIIIIIIIIIITINNNTKLIIMAS